MIGIFSLAKSVLFTKKYIFLQSARYDLPIWLRKISIKPSALLMETPSVLPDTTSKLSSISQKTYGYITFTQATEVCFKLYCIIKTPPSHGSIVEKIEVAGVSIFENNLVRIDFT